jgi:hypothetical protein
MGSGIIRIPEKRYEEASFEGGLFFQLDRIRTVENRSHVQPVSFSIHAGFEAGIAFS